jgi:hypothetical protein
LERVRRLAVLAQVFNGLALFSTVDEENFRSCVGQGERYRCAQPRTGTCHDCRRSREIKWIHEDP